MAIVAPFGSWASPVTADLLTERAVRLSDLRVVGDDVWWVEGRPAEGGRQVVVRAAGGREVADALPLGFSARTTVHEYGGAPYAVVGGRLVFANFDDQRLWLAVAGGDPRPLTAEPPSPGAWRYADLAGVPERGLVVAVRERHHGPAATEVENDLVAVRVDGDGSVGEPVALAGGHDFFAAPRPSPDGRRLAWLAWDHPDMPWDATELWVADLVDEPDGVRLVGARRVAGGGDTPASVSQPRWSPAGHLHWVSDRSGWWNLYAEDPQVPGGRPLAPRDAEFSRPDWVFGQSTYGFLADGRLVAAWAEDGADHLGILGSHGGVAELSTPFTDVEAVAPAGDDVVALAGSASEAVMVVAIAPGGATRVLRRSREATVDPAFVSDPRPLTFPTTGGSEAHALWYPPSNPDAEGPPGERPPLVVLSHGGPTSSASPALNLAVQFWTTRGLAVVDVDYRGSSGYGRAYRKALEGAWGVVDVDDCVAAARHLVDRGLVDPSRLVIRGGSAGGYTTLRALTTTDVFAAGASLYGVADLTALATDTHKFESRYLDRLVGPWPEAAERYREWSPINHADRLSCPVIVLQGLEDRVVPPAQAEVLVDALRAKGLPVAYVTFPGEQHGFRRAETIRRAAEAELSFYGQVLGFVPADAMEPVVVEHFERPPAW
ncbi:MAG: prolyl oligopeptidase family serine peptidase [Acidimicrobiales bacterium]